DARGMISVSQRQNYIQRVRDLARLCAEAFLKTTDSGARD
ncbi:MAG: glycine--tRNA ligase subunit alpha, partial [Hyphomicrobiales bacterium]|nr:glycine--tRNA ligase subunit alpha [Hyphomicrobiales bacterium]